MTDKEFVLRFFPDAKLKRLYGGDGRYVIKATKNGREDAPLSCAVTEAKDGWNDAKTYIFESLDVEYIEYLVPEFKDFNVIEVTKSKTFIEMSDKAIVIRHHNYVGR